MKEKCDQLDYKNMENFCTSEGIIKELKGQAAK